MRAVAFMDQDVCHLFRSSLFDEPSFESCASELCRGTCRSAQPVVLVEFPKGVWGLPPQQRVLKTEDTRFDLHAVAQELTNVMCTSATKLTPSVEALVAANESLETNLALRWCRDKVCRGGKWEQMWNDERESYDEYKAALHNTQLVFLEEFGHLFGTVKRGFSHVQTRWSHNTTCVSEANLWLRTRS